MKRISTFKGELVRSSARSFPGSMIFPFWNHSITTLTEEGERDRLNIADGELERAFLALGHQHARAVYPLEVEGLGGPVDVTLPGADEALEGDLDGDPRRGVCERLLGHLEAGLQEAVLAVEDGAEVEHVHPVVPPLHRQMDAAVVL